jgi:hypothetical protein
MTSSDAPRAGRAPVLSGGATPGFAMVERSVIATVLGVPPVAAFVLGAAGAGAGVLVDLLRIGTVGGVFTTLYFVGCVLAVAWVRRGSLFGPMVQPPLLLAVAVPAVVFLAAPPRPGSGITEQLIAVGAPLVNAFPAMATTTAVVLAVGGLRIVLQPLGPRRSGR